MKKLLLLAGLLPLAAIAQPTTVAPGSSTTYKQVEVRDAAPTSTGTIIRNNPRRSRELNFQQQTIATTEYDLATNGATYRKMQLYPGGRLSVVLTFGLQDVGNFPDRGSIVVHFDGTSWSDQPVTRLEGRRSGFSSINQFKLNGVTRELVVSHQASASSNTSFSGGLNLIRNTGIGKTDWTTFAGLDTITGGPLWPHTAVSGDKYLHIVTQSNDSARVSNGVRRPIVYTRYNLETDQVEANKIVLPGYDSTNFNIGQADEYNVDARDSVVAVAIGGNGNGLMVFKSIDNGRNWTNFLVQAFPGGYFRAATDTFTSRVASNLGDPNVLIDRNGKVHITYGQDTITNPTIGDSSYSITFKSTIMHWDENTRRIHTVGNLVDWNLDGDTLIGAGSFNQTPGVPNPNTNGAARYHGVPAFTYHPNLSVDASNNLYCVWDALTDALITSDAENFRHIYVSHSTNGGLTWSLPQDISKSNDSFAEAGPENVFPNVTRDADANLHVTWQQDPIPGTFVINKQNQGSTLNNIVYARVPLADIRNGSIGQLPFIRTVGIKDYRVALPNFITSIYPNPSADQATLVIIASKPSSAVVSVLNTMGQVVSRQDLGTLAQGSTQINLDLTTLAPGVYVVEVQAGETRSTQRLTVR